MTPETYELILKIIDRLLSFPVGEQLYRKEIALLFNLLEIGNKTTFEDSNKGR